MDFSQDSKVVQLCTRGMELEGQGKALEAVDLFNEAWDIAVTDFEKFTSAHYVARHQTSISNKLKWDETALKYALNINTETVKATLPSLYLNIGKCYEDLNDFSNAKNQYQSALSFFEFLPDDGYGKMIKSGVVRGLERVA